MSKQAEAHKADLYWDRWTAFEDKEACDHLIQRYMHLVDFHVQRIAAGLPKNVRHDDLKSHGLMGLYDALAKFDHKRELKFDTYASFRIRGAIIDGLRQEDWMPRSLREKAKRIEAAQNALEQQLGRMPEAGEVADECSLPEKEVLNVMHESLTSHLLSIDEKTGDGQSDETFVTTIVDEQMKSPEEHILTQDKYEELAIKMKDLTKNEQLVLSLFYFDELTLTEIGSILSLSTSRISQIHSKALFKLQRAFKSEV
ncbi:FliA/WhiG family RNA polymerase sigma factor [Bacillus sp. H-16]|uniref:FliA/WhiG family RNA polymerase sigma factor n=1 Tax=Alteribacter salitolerans TaxID=2912333 RepID=UPI0019630865|nr:FliA/WhiG family RNA polymerase sigma factor [Alteribacter salitolerans]MBM7094199.1 FliA/WhiG family RNA polymerase sigma factor [Alteribacter salitolerans]